VVSWQSWGCLSEDVSAMVCEVSEYLRKHPSFVELIQTYDYHEVPPDVPFMLTYEPDGSRIITASFSIPTSDLYRDGTEAFIGTCLRIMEKARE